MKAEEKALAHSETREQAAKQRLEFWHDDQDRAWATIPKNGSERVSIP